MRTRASTRSCSTPPGFASSRSTRCPASTKKLARLTILRWAPPPPRFEMNSAMWAASRRCIDVPPAAGWPDCRPTRPTIPGLARRSRPGRATKPARPRAEATRRRATRLRGPGRRRRAAAARGSGRRTARSSSRPRGRRRRAGSAARRGFGRWPPQAPRRRRPAPARRSGRSSRISRGPLGQSVLTSGQPHAIAWISTPGSPSQREDRTKTDARAM